eukprot:scaffold5.g628.t1
MLVPSPRRRTAAALALVLLALETLAGRAAGEELAVGSALGSPLDKALSGKADNLARQLVGSDELVQRLPAVPAAPTVIVPPALLVAEASRSLDGEDAALIAATLAGAQGLRGPPAPCRRGEREFSLSAVWPRATASAAPRRAYRAWASLSLSRNETSVGMSGRNASGFEIRAGVVVTQRLVLLSNARAGQGTASMAKEVREVEVFFTISGLAMVCILGVVVLALLHCVYPEGDDEEEGGGDDAAEWEAREAGAAGACEEHVADRGCQAAHGGCYDGYEKLAGEAPAGKQ